MRLFRLAPALALLFFGSATASRGQYAAPTLAASAHCLIATAKWEGDDADIPPAAIVEETLDGPRDLDDAVLPDDATPVSRVASGNRVRLRALTLVEKPGKRISRKLTLPTGTRYSLRILLPFVGGGEARYGFRLPEGFSGNLKTLTVRLGDGKTLCETGRFGAGGAPSGVRYAPAALGDGKLVRFVTTATNDKGQKFADEDWFVTYARSGQARGFSLPLLAGTVRAQSDAPSSVAPAEAGLRDALLRHTREATTLTFALHGCPDALAPTLRWDDPQKVTASELATQTARRGWRPPLQLVFADACSTLADGARAIPGALGIKDGDRGRAYVGFDAPAVVDGNTARLFWEALRDGKTVREATGEAQAYYDAHNALGGVTYPALLHIVGDPDARLSRLPGVAPSEGGFALISDEAPSRN